MDQQARDINVGVGVRDKKRGGSRGFSKEDCF